MYDYIVGKITDIESSYISLDNNGIGYLIYTANPYSFNIESDYKIYLYQNIKEDESSLYGFPSKEERSLFLKLISVKGLGPKMALPMLAAGSISGIADAIERENILYLKKFPKIGDKLARQIILDLKGKLVETKNQTPVNDELSDALKALGYKGADINRVVSKVDKKTDIEEQIKEALRLLLK